MPVDNKFHHPVDREQKMRSKHDILVLVLVTSLTISIHCQDISLRYASYHTRTKADSTDTTDCYGSLTFFVQERSVISNVFLSGDHEELDLGRRGSLVSHVTTDGSCCWILYSQPYFRGQSMALPKQFTGRPGFRPGSVEKAVCY